LKLLIAQGPDYPPIDQTNCTYVGNHTCNTDIHNIVDVYYFDAADFLSCHHQVDRHSPLFNVLKKVAQADERTQD
jgi:hypothetical protein